VSGLGETELDREYKRAYCEQLGRDYKDAFTGGDVPNPAAFVASHAALLEALQDCAESLDFARLKLGMSGPGDHKDRKADAPDDIGSSYALEAARQAIDKANQAKGST